MARAKQCEEEFNPWPPFVDVFSSVVLVLLLFIMVLIVNVAYYMQFNSKLQSEAKSAAKIDSLQRGQDTSDMIVLPKIKKPPMSTAGNDALFEGGKASGNAISSGEKKPKEYAQKTEKSRNAMTITYDDKELFLKADSVKQVANFMKQNKGKKIVITMGLPTHIPSRTYAKQIALSRVISVKSILLKNGLKAADLQFHISQRKDPKYPKGFVKIKVVR